MKIEKLNDNQIRCTLTRTDLADREIKLSELVCGTEKAKSLFQDMMQKAHSEFGFETEDMPLMIEAVPASSDSIVLIITKVDDPEEVDAGLYVDWVPPGVYGVFTSPPTDKDFAQRVMDTWRYIFEVWLPDSPYAWNPVGLDYEFYDERCHGAPYSMDICIPLLPKGETSCPN